MNPHYRQIAAQARHRCEYCRAPEVVFNFPFEVEHVIPPMHGGAGEEDNLALACRACNVRKGAAVQHIDPETQIAVHLYHPRTDRWSDHFRVDVGIGIIEGLTAAGRASVACMAMNSAS